MLISRAASSSNSSSLISVYCGWKQERVLIIAESMAIGGASTGKPSKWCLNASCSGAWWVSRSLKRSSSAWFGSRPKISSQAVSTKVERSASCSMGMPR